MATYDGTPDDDVFTGGTEDDTLVGGLGDDTLSGMGGNDRLEGGPGNDVLDGGAGADEIDGGADDGLRFDPTSARGAIWGDTAAYVDSDAGVTIDLAMGTAEGGHAEGDTLTGIESVRGSDHADMLVARVEGGSTLYGQGGNDTLTGGGTARDYLWGDEGDDVLMGGGGSDYLEGGSGSDVLDGGDGFDFVGYELSDSGVTIDLAAGTAQGGHAEGDTLKDVEWIYGSSLADRLTGNDKFNLFLGGPGADTLDGGEGPDQANYYTSDSGVTVNLATGTAEGGHAEGDTLTDIEQITGSFLYADHLTGDDGNNSLVGRGGNDTLEGGAGNDRLSGNMGADVLDGGDGFDSADYRGADAGVTVDLATGTGQGGEAEGDTLRGIEEVRGSDHADHLTGDDEDNRLDGRGGDDTLEGGAGNDRLEGHAGNDMLDGGAGNDWLHGGAGADRLAGGDGDDDWAQYWGSNAGVTVNLATGTGQGGHAEGDTFTGIEKIHGSDHADHLTGDDGDNGFNGDAGADTLDGGEGWDFVGYWGSDAGVTVNLATGTGQGGHAEGDTLTGIESIGGSDHADHLTGDDGDNYLNGDAGADTLDGGEGDDTAGYWGSDAGVTVNLATGTGQGGHAEGDTLTGFEGIAGSYQHADHLIGDHGNNGLNGDGGNDTLEGGAGDDWLDGGAGADRLAGGTGYNNLLGGAGADVLDGSEGQDDAIYWDSDAGVTVNLATGTGQGGHAEGDTLTGIEEVSGSDHADHLTGDAGENRLNGHEGNDTLEGGAGDDWLDGGAGADVLDGGEGDDWAQYGGSDASVTVNLATGTGQGGHAEGDTLTGIEKIHGSDHADHLIGHDGNNGFHGDAGADTIDGGEGYDYVSYWGSEAGITVNLATGTGQGGHAEGDTFTGIESINGSDHADHLTGDDGDNYLNGRGGADTLDGGGGNDWLDGWDGEDLLTGGEGADTFVFGDGDTVADFEDGSDVINIDDFGHVNADNFETEVAIRQVDDDVEVRIGDAVLTLTGVSAAAITSEDFFTPEGDDGNQDLHGSNGNDLFIGTDEADEILGLGGIDLLRGGAGDDTIQGGSGPDSLYGDKDNDTIAGGPGDDLIRGGKGDDTLDGGDGRDMIRADLGDDHIWGSEGGDYIDGADGIDVASYGRSPEPVTIDLSSPGVIIPGVGGYAEGDILVNIENIDGSPHDDVISVADDWETPIQHGVWAGAGDDEIWGFRVDYLNGGDGDDYLNMQEGGVGAGGPGADTFNLFGDSIEGRIEDFNPDEGDKIRLNGDGFGGVDENDLQAMLDGSSGDTLDLSVLAVPGMNHTTIVLQDFDVADLTVDDFILL